MQARINELESLVKTKDNKFNQEKKSSENKMQEFNIKINVLEKENQEYKSVAKNFILNNIKDVFLQANPGK